MRRPRRRTLAAALLTLSLFAVPLTLRLGPSGPSAGTGPRLAPATGALLGAYVPPPQSGAQRSETLNALERALGRRLSVDMHFYDFADDFPSALEDADRAAHRIPLITWLPGEMSFQRIAAGGEDRVLRARARAVRAFGAPVFLRWAAEMNSDGHPRPDPVGAAPTFYIAAWRHLHRVFDQEGVHNVAWVWCPNHVDVPATTANHWTNFYPGDSFVDWVGVDGYNAGATSSTGSQSLPELVQGVYDDYADRKPLMIAETGSTDDQGGRAQWLDESRVLLKDQLPAVKALVYFDKPSAFSLDGSPASLAAFRRFLLDPYFAGAAGGGAAALPP